MNTIRIVFQSKAFPISNYAHKWQRNPCGYRRCRIHPKYWFCLCLTKNWSSQLQSPNRDLRFRYGFTFLWIQEEPFENILINVPKSCGTLTWVSTCIRLPIDAKSLLATSPMYRMNDEITGMCCDLSAVGVFTEHYLEPFRWEAVVILPVGPRTALKACPGYSENILEDLVPVSFGRFPNSIKLVHTKIR